MGRRRNVFVDHRVATAAAVVFISHLLAHFVPQPVGGPGFSLGNVVTQGTLKREEAASVSLGT